jgi:uncharacterized protein (TIGR03435 family)
MPGVMNVLAVRAQSSPSGKSARAARPKFGGISVKPCRNSDPFPGGRGGGTGTSPGRVHLECANVGNLIKRAYLQFPNGEKEEQMPAPPADRVLGVPGWTDSDHYTIDATTETPQPTAQLLGPMVHALLENRFKLRIHRHTRMLPVYELRVTGAVRLLPAKGENCLIVDSDHPPPLLPEEGQPVPAICGGFAVRFVYGATMKRLGEQLRFRADRDVVDKTGIAGTFDLDLGSSPRSCIANSGRGLSRLAEPERPCIGFLRGCLIEARLETRAGQGFHHPRGCRSYGEAFGESGVAPSITDFVTGPG